MKSETSTYKEKTHAYNNLSLSPGDQEGAGHRRRGHRLGSDREARLRDGEQPSLPRWPPLLLPGP